MGDTAKKSGLSKQLQRDEDNHLQRKPNTEKYVSLPHLQYCHLHLFLLGLICKLVQILKALQRQLTSGPEHKMCMISMFSRAVICFARFLRTIKTAQEIQPYSFGPVQLIWILPSYLDWTSTQARKMYRTSRVLLYLMVSCVHKIRRGVPSRRFTFGHHCQGNDSRHCTAPSPRLNDIEPFVPPFTKYMVQEV